MELIITPESFLKTAKKLQKNIKSNGLDLSLSKSQEILSQSLGFRNLNAINTYFEKIKLENMTSNKDINIPLLDNLNEEQLIILFSMHLGDDMWGSRARILCDTVIKFISYMKEEKEIILSIDMIREYFILENIIKIYKTRRDFPNHIRNALRSYLLSLPSFQENAPKQNDTVLEQHGYLQMQFSQIFAVLDKLEKYRFILIPKSIVLFIKNYDFSSLYEEKEFYDYLTNKWEHSQSSNFFNKEIISLIKNQKIQDSLYLHDLLLYSLNYIGSEKRKSLFSIVEQFTQNLTVVKMLSKDLEKIKI